MITALRFASSLFTAAAISLITIGLASTSATALANGGPFGTCGNYDPATMTCSSPETCPKGLASCMVKMGCPCT